MFFILDEEILEKDFYLRDPDEVAEDLLGKLMVREVDGEVLSGYVVETEAYFGRDDPASRAAQNGKTDMTEVMWGEPGTVFVYMVHGHWMLNVVTGREGEPSAVLFRALEPEDGVDIMRDNRGRRDLEELCSGPGKLTQALDIGKDLNKANFCTEENLFIVDEDFEDFEIGRSKRIGVSEDLEEPMRFYLGDSEFTSR